MNQKQILAAVEAMLFACGDPIGADKLAQAVQLPQSSVDAALETLHTRYQREDSGLCLLHLNTRWQLATKTEWADCVRRVLDSRRAVPLGPAAMETLTVIAYNQPVSRAFIEQVRGVDSSSSVSGLLEKGLIEEAGALIGPGLSLCLFLGLGHCKCLLIQSSKPRVLVAPRGFILSRLALGKVGEICRVDVQSRVAIQVIQCLAHRVDGVIVST